MCGGHRLGIETARGGEASADKRPSGGEKRSYVEVNAYSFLVQVD